MYHLPHYENLPEVEITAITMRGDRPIYRNHQTCPDTDHQPLPRLCHEAVLYNRLSEIGLAVKDVRFPTWGAALSCILQFDYPREGMVNDALMTAMGAPWLNTKLVVAVSPDTDLDDAGRRLSRHRDALRSGARRHHGAEHARLALRPFGAAARRPLSVAHRRQDGHRCHQQSRATIPPISNAPGRATGARSKLRRLSLKGGIRNAMEIAIRHDAPSRKVLFEAEPFIPYVQGRGLFDPRLKPVVEPYKKRMGFLPNALKLYAHRPEIAETLWRLNSNIMRDPILDARPVPQAQARGGRLRHQRLRLLHRAQLLDAEEAAWLGFGGLGSERGRAPGPDHRRLSAGKRDRARLLRLRARGLRRPDLGADEILQRLKQHLTPPQIVELACVVGFWKFYNTVHDSLHIPVECQLLQDTGYVDLVA